MRLSTRTFGRSATSRPSGIFLADLLGVLVAPAPSSARTITPQLGGRNPANAEFIGECRYEWECNACTCGRGTWQLVETGHNQPVGVVARTLFDRYQVSLKVWIPHRATADPTRPVKTRYSVLTQNCSTPDSSFEDSTRVRTVFCKDNRNTFLGSYVAPC
jgi:hypothetical protein